MKNRNIMRILAWVLALIMMLSIVACNSETVGDPTDAPTDAPTDTPTDDPSADHTHAFGEAVETKAPTCTEKGEKTATCECGETQVTEIDTVAHTYADGVCSVCGAADPDAEHTHAFGEAVETKAPTCTAKGEKTATCECGETQVTEIDTIAHNYVDGACTVCGGEDPAVHVHAYVNGQCACGDIPVVSDESAYDSDGDNVNDTFYFTPIIPSGFTGDDVYHIAASDYDQTLSSQVSTSSAADITHYYVTEGTGGYIVYNIEVEESGIYELAIHMRLKDTQERGTKYIINEGTIFEYSFETSFQLDDASLALARTNDSDVTSYMYGIYVNLTEGANTIKIAQSSASPKCQHYRDLYLVRLASWTPVFAVGSAFDADGDGVNDTHYLSSTLPYEFLGDGVVHVWAGDYDRELTPSGFKNTTNADGSGIDHWYIEENSGACLVYKVTVAEAGVYDMAVHLRLKDAKHRGTIYTINEGTDAEYSFSTSFYFNSDSDAQTIRDPATSSAYMSGMQVTLVAGDNYIKIEHAPECPKSQHYRDFYFIKAES